MSFLDKAKRLADKAVVTAKEHSEQIEKGIDKASGMADRATKGRYTDKIDKVHGKAKEAVDKLDDGKGGTPGAHGF